MRIRTLDELLLLPERTAVTRHVDGVNWQRFRWIAACFIAASGIVAIEAAQAGVGRRLWSAVGFLVVLTVFVLLRRTRTVEASFRWLIIALVALQLVAIALWSDEIELVSVFLALIAPLVLLLLRFEGSTSAALCAATAAVALTWHLVHGATVERALLWAFLLTIPAMLTAPLGVRITRQRRKQFVDRWRLASTRERERLRMRGELADARKIQLSMLPAGDPDIDWLDLSGVCLPAVEVGGDYFDYIRLDDDAFVLVMADVAGHGVASGLLIAGLRSSLYVLHEHLRSPAEVLDRLNLMVRESVRHRTFVTVSVALVERLPRGQGGQGGGGTGRIRVASAGHPPVLHWRAADGSVREVGAEAPPLGTRLPATYREDAVDLAPGDLVLLYTDGLVEAVDYRTDAFGFDRLEEALAQAAATGAARAVRNDLLDSVARFKGETLQADDLSIIVARFLGEGDRSAEAEAADADEDKGAPEGVRRRQSLGRPGRNAFVRRT